MVTVTALWLPILLSAIAVFAASSIFHMVINIHKNDYTKLPGEAAVMAAMRDAGVQPGNYVFPCPADPKDMGSAEMLEKYKQGPVGFANVMPSAPPAMGKYLGLWFVYTLIVGVFVAYLTGRVVGSGSDYLAVFRVAGTSAFMSYGLANIVESIWKAQSWGTTFRHVFDGLVYSLLTAGVFGWLWP